MEYEGNNEVLAKLVAPIPESEIGWKPQVVRADEGYAIMVAYVDARFVAERLDYATDGNWSFHFEVLHESEESVVVRGSLRVFGDVRQDVGEYRRQGNRDDMDMYKAAVSDALKRAAVLFGVGREIYRLPVQRVAWDVARKRVKAGELDRLMRVVREIRERAANKPVTELERMESSAEYDEMEQGVSASDSGVSSEEVEHWTRNRETTTAFWSWVRRQTLRNDEVLQVLGVKSLLDYKGTKEEAFELVKAYIKEHAG